MPSEQHKLTPKQKTFCEEYIVDLNGTQAAIRAGYSKRTANEQAAQLLAKLNIQAYVEELMIARSERTQINADMVLQELAKMGFANMADYTKVQDGVLVSELSDLSRDEMAAIQEFTVDVRHEKGRDGESIDTIERFRFKLADKRGALELLGKHLKLFTDKVEHSVPEGISFWMNYVGKEQGKSGN